VICGARIYITDFEGQLPRAMNAVLCGAISRRTAGPGANLHRPVTGLARRAPWSRSTFLAKR